MNNSRISYFCLDGFTMPIPSKPVFTDVFESVEAFVPAEDSVYVLRQSIEERSSHASNWRERFEKVEVVEIIDEGRSTITVNLPSGKRSVQLRSGLQLSGFWNDVKRR